MSCNALAHATWSWLDSTELKRCVGVVFAAKCLESAVLTINCELWQSINGLGKLNAIRIKQSALHARKLSL